MVIARNVFYDVAIRRLLSLRAVFRRGNPSGLRNDNTVFSEYLHHFECEFVLLLFYYTPPVVSKENSIKSE